jgi:hypothetical protein
LALKQLRLEHARGFHAGRSDNAPLFARREQPRLERCHQFQLYLFFAMRNRFVERWMHKIVRLLSLFA